MKSYVLMMPTGRLVACLVPETAGEMRNGLQGFAPLEHQGMLFRFGSPRVVTMQMAEVSFPIDVVFLREREVTAIFANRLPGCDEEWTGLADEVLELAGNWCEVHGLAVGMHV
jgi:uncharacterized membrane protein (UPF0127 family)